MIIGEAVKLLSEELRAQHADMSWSDIARMRDTLIHRYFGVNLEKVWLTVRDDLPVLKDKITSILAKLQEQSSENEDQ